MYEVSGAWECGGTSEAGDWIRWMRNFQCRIYKIIKYVEPPVYHPGYALHKKSDNAFQQRYYGKLYRMCVVQKCRFQYKYTRYQQDLTRMKELQEEYLFLNREGINGWEDVFRAKQTAEQKIADIDAKKKELYKEHARYKYQYEKDGDVTVYLYHEAHYREQLAEFKERRKEAKRKCATINRCINESTFAHMEIPLDMDVENLYMVDVPEFEREEISYAKSMDYDEATEYITAETDEYIESYVEEEILNVDLPGIADVLSEGHDVVAEPVIAKVLQEETVVASEEFYYGVNESEIVEGEAYLQKFEKPDRTKKNIAKELGIPEETVFPHSFRHLFAKNYMEKIGDITELADILGHSRLETTWIYTKTSSDEKRKRLGLLDL